jgi:hypothetical protein
MEGVHRSPRMPAAALTRPAPLPQLIQMPLRSGLTVCLLLCRPLSTELRQLLLQWVLLPQMSRQRRASRPAVPHPVRQQRPRGPLLLLLLLPRRPRPADAPRARGRRVRAQERFPPAASRNLPQDRRRKRNEAERLVSSSLSSLFVFFFSFSSLFCVFFLRMALPCFSRHGRQCSLVSLSICMFCLLYPQSISPLRLRLSEAPRVLLLSLSFSVSPCFPLLCVRLFFPASSRLSCVIVLVDDATASTACTSLVFLFVCACLSP